MTLHAFQVEHLRSATGSRREVMQPSCLLESRKYPLLPTGSMVLREGEWGKRGEEAKGLKMRAVGMRGETLKARKVVLR